MKTHADSVTIERMLNAPVQKVWSAWTDPKQVLLWFGSDPNGIGINSTLDVRVDGRYEITFQDSDKTEHTCSGCYREVNKHHKLIFTWRWKSEPETESVVTVIFQSQDDRTQMLFEHAGVGTASIHNYVSGWRGAFDKLETLLSKV